MKCAKAECMKNYNAEAKNMEAEAINRYSKCIYY